MESLSPGQVGSTNLPIDFTGCPLAASNGAVTGYVVRANQLSVGGF
jgi:hypothetical protein